MTTEQASLVATLVHVVDKIQPTLIQQGSLWVVEAKNLETGAIITLEHVGHMLDLLSKVFSNTSDTKTVDSGT